MPLFRRRNAADRMKARRAERRYNRKVSMRATHRLTSGPISMATKMARKRLKIRGFYRSISKLREALKLPKYRPGIVVEADPRVLATILEAASASMDPEAFAAAYATAQPEYLGTDVGLAALEFEAWVAEHETLAEKFIETVVEPGRDTFTATFYGKLEERDLSLLDDADFVALRSLIEAGDKSYETGTVSDINVFECSPDAAAFEEDGEFEEYDPLQVRNEGGLTQEAMEFIAGTVAPMEEGATVQVRNATWKREGERWFLIGGTQVPTNEAGPVIKSGDATMPSLAHIQDDPKAVAAALLASVDWPAKWNGDEWANSATLRMKHLKKGAAVAAELVKQWDASSASKPTVRGWIVSMGIDGGEATKMLSEDVAESAIRVVDEESDPTKLAQAREIHKQVGPHALFMLGAKNLAVDASGDPAFSFKIGKNAKGVTHIRITLMPDDTYTVKFLKVRGTTITTVSTQEGVYADNLHKTLEHGTGMYTSMGTMGKKPANESYFGSVQIMCDDWGGKLRGPHGDEESMTLTFPNKTKFDGFIRNFRLEYPATKLTTDPAKYVVRVPNTQVKEGVDEATHPKLAQHVKDTHALAKEHGGTYNTSPFRPEVGVLHGDVGGFKDQEQAGKFAAAAKKKFPKSRITHLHGTSVTVSHDLREATSTNEGDDDPIYTFNDLDETSDAVLKILKSVKVAGAAKQTWKGALERLEKAAKADNGRPDTVRAHAKALEAAAVVIVGYGRKGGGLAKDGPEMKTAAGAMQAAHAFKTWGGSNSAMESAPPGWKGSVEAMKAKHPDKFGKGPGKLNPYAIAWAAKRKGYKPHYRQSAHGDPVKIKEALEVSDADAALLAPFIVTEGILSEALVDSSPAGRWNVEASGTTTVIAFPTAVFALEGHHEDEIIRLVGEAEAAYPDPDEMDAAIAASLREYAEAHGKPMADDATDEATTSANVGGFSADVLGKVAKLRKAVKSKDKNKSDDDVLKQTMEHVQL